MKENHFKDGKPTWVYYEEVPAAFAVGIFNDENTFKAAIVKWNLVVDDEFFTGNTIEDLKLTIKYLTKKYSLGKSSYKKEVKRRDGTSYVGSFDKKLIVFCEDLGTIHQFIKKEFDCSVFNVNGKGIGSCILNDTIELRDVKFIGTDDWKKFSNADSTTYKLLDFAKYYYDHIAKTDGSGKAPITLQQVIKQELKNKMTVADKELVYECFPNKKKDYEDAMKYMYIGAFCDNKDQEEYNETMGHIDFKTSYVARMLLDYYPISSFKLVNVNEFADAIKTKCCKIKVTFKNFEAKKFKFLQDKRCIFKEHSYYKVDELHRILYAEEVTFLLNELDFELATNFYDYRSYEIKGLAVADRGQLPAYVREVAEKHFIGKETCDGIDKIWEKMLTEIVYGATCKAIYNMNEKSWKDIREEAILSPYWGIWTTSHARYALMMFAAALGEDWNYSDTDSLFFTNPLLHVQLIEKYNENVRARMFKYCVENEADYNVLSELGTFTYEDGSSSSHFTITRFKALGPKRYIYTIEDSELVTKIAGYKKQYKKDGALVNVWAFKYDKDSIYDVFEDNFKIQDVQKFSISKDEPCEVEYDGKIYKMKSYKFTGYRRTNKSTIEMFEEAGEAYDLLKELQDSLGKERR